ncbi:MAG: PHP domain-containing protein [Desulfobacterales bacterium]|jgi:predicted metal-dependent phosphoesterase TrpH
MNQHHRIQFTKPDLPQLNRSATVVDMHFHSHYSDGANSIPKIAQKARELGIGVAITDHNEIRGAVEMSRIKSVLSIPGIEVTSREGTHLLVYFYLIRDLKRFFNTHIAPHRGPDVMSSTDLEMEELIERARRYESLVILPHPYCAAYTGIFNSYFPEKRLDTVLEMVDGVEGFNGSNLNRWNMRCALLGFNLSKVITGGSDGHSLRHMGVAVTYAECKRRRRHFLDAVKHQQVKIVGKELALLRKVTSNGRKLKSNLKNYPDLVEKNIRYSYVVINNKSKQIRENMFKGINGKRRSHI